MKEMNRSFFSFASVAMLLVCGGFLALSPMATAQMNGGMPGGSPGGMQNGNMNGGMNRPGMPGNQPNGMIGQQNSMQATMEQNFLGNMRRNSLAETQLSKLALKNSGNDNVKKMAQQVIAENRRLNNALDNSTTNDTPNSLPFAPSVPSETRKAEKQMKKLSGTQFDQAYLSQMDGYIKNDKQLVQQASSGLNSPDLHVLTMQVQRTADSRMQQLQQVAQSENFKIE